MTSPFQTKTTGDILLHRSLRCSGSVGEERRLLPSLPPQAFGRAREAVPAASTAPVGSRPLGAPQRSLALRAGFLAQNLQTGLYRKTKRAACSPATPATSGLAAASSPRSPRGLQTRSDQRGPEWVLDVGPLPLEILGAAISTTPRDSPPRRKRGKSAPEARGWRGTLPAGPASAQRAGVEGIPNGVQVHWGCPP